MNTGVVATRYAKAIYEFALGKGQEEVVYRDFGVLLKNYFKLPELTAVLKDPTVSLKQKSELLLTACGDPKNETLCQIIHLILKNGRINHLENIALVYEEYYRNSKGIVIAELTTVAPTDEKAKKNLIEVIAKITNNQVEFHTKTDPDIIGGFVLDVKNTRLNASIKDQLNRLRLELTTKS